MKKLFLIAIITVLMLTLVGCGNTQNSNKDANGTFRIKFKDLVSFDELQKYKDKEVEAVGFIAPISPVDGSFAYLMNMPYQSCPFCIPDSNRITNTIAIFPKANKTIDFTDSAVIVKGILKLEEYTDDYGYTYDYRLTDVTITKANEGELGEKIAIYNQIADNNILLNIMNALGQIDNNVFYDEYSAYGMTEQDLAIVDTTDLDTSINTLTSLNKSEYEILLTLAKDVKEIAIETNKLLENKDYEALKNYKDRVLQDFDNLNIWMGDYEL